MPELVLVELDAALGRNEPDAEIRELLRASVGVNLGMDFLPGSVMFDPAAGDAAEPELASTAVWLDAFVTNVDRTARNPNLASGNTPGPAPDFMWPERLSLHTNKWLRYRSFFAQN